MHIRFNLWYELKEQMDGWMYIGALFKAYTKAGKQNQGQYCCRCVINDHLIFFFLFLYKNNDH